jgi:hypothetical protein
LSQFETFFHSKFRSARSRIEQAALAHFDRCYDEAMLSQPRRIPIDLPPVVEREPKPAPPAIVATPIIRRNSIELILDAVVEAYPEVSKIDIKSARRTANVVRPRQITMYLAKKLTLKSLPEIGRRLGGRDHTTVLHGVRRIERMLPDNPELAAEISYLETRLSPTVPA